MSTRSRAQKRKASAQKEAESGAMPEIFFETVDPFQLTTCSICGGSEDEDLIILCDGPGCNNEIHMYCLTPILTEIPKGNWYCDACDSSGTTFQLKRYFDTFEKTQKHLCLKTNEPHFELLKLLQQRYIKFDLWSPLIETKLIDSEFDASSIDLIGCIVRISVTDTQFHSGRIINRSYNDYLGIWYHLIQFKSGIEGRNAPWMHWICLDEHACKVGGAVLWARVPDFPWWPAQEYYQSGMLIAATQYSQGEVSNNNTRNEATTKKKQEQIRDYSSYNSNEFEGLAVNKDDDDEEYLLYFFFGDETYSLINSNDSQSVIPFYQKSRETRFYVGKKLNTAYALACLEREEMLAARRAYHYFSVSEMERNGGSLVDGFTVQNLKAVTSIGNSLWDSYCSVNGNMIQHEYNSKDRSSDNDGSIVSNNTLIEPCNISVLSNANTIDIIKEQPNAPEIAIADSTNSDIKVEDSSSDNDKNKVSNSGSNMIIDVDNNYNSAVVVPESSSSEQFDTSDNNNHSNTAVVATINSEGSVAAGAVPTIDLSQNKLLCLDLVYLAIESGLRLSTALHTNEDDVVAGDNNAGCSLTSSVIKNMDHVDDKYRAKILLHNNNNNCTSGDAVVTIIGDKDLDEVTSRKSTNISVSATATTTTAKKKNKRKRNNNNSNIELTNNDNNIEFPTVTSDKSKDDLVASITNDLEQKQVGLEKKKSTSLKVTIEPFSVYQLIAENYRLSIKKWREEQVAAEERAEQERRAIKTAARKAKEEASAALRAVALAEAKEKAAIATAKRLVALRAASDLKKANISLQATSNDDAAVDDDIKVNNADQTDATMATLHTTVAFNESSNGSNKKECQEILEEGSQLPVRTVSRKEPRHLLKYKQRSSDRKRKLDESVAASATAIAANITPDLSTSTSIDPTSSSSGSSSTRLLTDLDRAQWLGSVVMYLTANVGQVGRVIDYEGGWVVVRTLQTNNNSNNSNGNNVDSDVHSVNVNCRPYQLEIVEADTEVYAQYEDMEMWMLCSVAAASVGDCAENSKISVNEDSVAKNDIPAKNSDNDNYWPTSSAAMEQISSFSSLHSFSPQLQSQSSSKWTIKKKKNEQKSCDDESSSSSSNRSDYLAFGSSSNSDDEDAMLLMLDDEEEKEDDEHNNNNNNNNNSSNYNNQMIGVSLFEDEKNKVGNGPDFTIKPLLSILKQQDNKGHATSSNNNSTRTMQQLQQRNLKPSRVKFIEDVPLTSLEARRRVKAKTHASTAVNHHHNNCNSSNSNISTIKNKNADISANKTVLLSKKESEISVGVAPLYSENQQQLRQQERSRIGNRRIDSDTSCNDNKNTILSSTVAAEITSTNKRFKSSEIIGVPISLLRSAAAEVKAAPVLANTANNTATALHHSSPLSRSSVVNGDNNNIKEERIGNDDSTKKDKHNEEDIFCREYNSRNNDDCETVLNNSSSSNSSARNNPRLNLSADTTVVEEQQGVAGRTIKYYPESYNSNTDKSRQYGNRDGCDDDYPHHPSSSSSSHSAAAGWKQRSDYDATTSYSSSSNKRDNYNVKQQNSGEGRRRGGNNNQDGNSSLTATDTQQRSYYNDARENFNDDDVINSKSSRVRRSSEDWNKNSIKNGCDDVNDDKHNNSRYYDRSDEKHHYRSNSSNTYHRNNTNNNNNSDRENGRSTIMINDSRNRSYKDSSYHFKQQQQTYRNNNTLSNRNSNSSYRSNSKYESSAVRTMRANIAYLQSGYYDDEALKENNDHIGSSDHDGSNSASVCSDGIYDSSSNSGNTGEYGYTSDNKCSSSGNSRHYSAAENYYQRESYNNSSMEPVNTATASSLPEVSCRVARSTRWGQSQHAHVNSNNSMTNTGDLNNRSDSNSSAYYWNNETIDDVNDVGRNRTMIATNSESHINHATNGVTFIPTQLELQQNNLDNNNTVDNSLQYYEDDVEEEIIPQFSPLHSSSSDDDNDADEEDKETNQINSMKSASLTKRNEDKEECHIRVEEEGTVNNNNTVTVALTTGSQSLCNDVDEIEALLQAVSKESSYASKDQNDNNNDDKEQEQEKSHSAVCNPVVGVSIETTGVVAARRSRFGTISNISDGTDTTNNTYNTAGDFDVSTSSAATTTDDQLTRIVHNTINNHDDINTSISAMTKVERRRLKRQNIAKERERELRMIADDLDTFEVATEISDNDSTDNIDFIASVEDKIDDTTSSAIDSQISEMNESVDNNDQNINKETICNAELKEKEVKIENSAAAADDVEEENSLEPGELVDDDDSSSSYSSGYESCEDDEYYADPAATQYYCNDTAYPVAAVDATGCYYNNHNSNNYGSNNGIMPQYDATGMMMNMPMYSQLPVPPLDALHYYPQLSFQEQLSHPSYQFMMPPPGSPPPQLFPPRPATTTTNAGEAVSRSLPPSIEKKIHRHHHHTKGSHHKQQRGRDVLSTAIVSGSRNSSSSRRKNKTKLHSVNNNNGTTTIERVTATTTTTFIPPPPPPQLSPSLVSSQSAYCNNNYVATEAPISFAPPLPPNPPLLASFEPRCENTDITTAVATAVVVPLPPPFVTNLSSLDCHNNNNSECYIIPSIQQSILSTLMLAEQQQHPPFAAQQPVLLLPPPTPYSTIATVSSRVKQPQQQQQQHVVIDRQYPQFNHINNADSAIAHINVVGPQGMDNLNSLLLHSGYQQHHVPLGYGDYVANYNNCRMISRNNSDDMDAQIPSFYNTSYNDSEDINNSMNNNNQVVFGSYSEDCQTQLQQQQHYKGSTDNSGTITTTLRQNCHTDIYYEYEQSTVITEPISYPQNGVLTSVSYKSNNYNNNNYSNRVIMQNDNYYYRSDSGLTYNNNYMHSTAANRSDSGLTYNNNNMHSTAALEPGEEQPQEQDCNDFIQHRHPNELWRQQQQPGQQHTQHSNFVAAAVVGYSSDCHSVYGDNNNNVDSGAINNQAMFYHSRSPR